MAASETGWSLSIRIARLHEDMNENLSSHEIAPVVFLVFNRPDAAARVFERIRAAKPKRLFVVADGPRPTQPEDVRLCEQTQRIATSLDWPCELQTNIASVNLGCRRRISSGLDWVFDRCPEAIILEDDCVPSDSFFEFCTVLLERFRNEARVMSIGGANFQLGHSRGSASYYFSAYTHIWGWATWRRAWERIDIHLASWPAARQKNWVASVLVNPEERKYWNEIFEKSYRGEIDSWGYPWLYSCWLESGLCAVANQNLVTNIGSGPQATHTKGDAKALGIPSTELTKIIHPRTVSRNTAADRFHWEQHILCDIIRERNTHGWLGRIRKKLAIRSRIRSLLTRARLSYHCCC